MSLVLPYERMDVPVSPKLDEWVEQIDRIISDLHLDGPVVPVIHEGEIVLELRGFALWQLFRTERHGMTWGPVVPDVRAWLQHQPGLTGDPTMNIDNTEWVEVCECGHHLDMHLFTLVHHELKNRTDCNHCACEQFTVRTPKVKP